MYQCEKCGQWLIWDYRYGFYCPKCGLPQLVYSDKTLGGLPDEYTVSSGTQSNC